MLTNSPIPVMIVTGFLGAGKTTLLNRLLTSEHSLQVAVLVNDFGSINIDSQLVLDVDAASASIQLTNGCICCTIRGDLVQAIHNLVARDPRPDLIIIETSGVSDPIDVVLTLRSLETIRIESVLTVIDAEQVLALSKNEDYRDLVWNQIGTADLIVLNKIDLVDAAQREAATNYVRSISRDARLVEAVAGNVPLSLLLGQGAFDPQQWHNLQAQEVHVHDVAHAHSLSDHSTIFTTWSWRSHQPISVRALRRVLERLPQAVYRAKGIFYSVDDPTRRLVAQVVGKRVVIDEDGALWGDAEPASEFVVIGLSEHLDSAALTQLMDNALVQNGVSALMKKLLSWPRA